MGRANSLTLSLPLTILAQTGESEGRFSMEETFRAVFENGVLRPLRPIRLREKSQVVVTLHRESQWQKEFDRLIRRMKARTKGVPQREIEAEVTRARAEVRAN